MKINLTESKLKQIVTESVNKILSEDYDPYTGKPIFNRSDLADERNRQMRQQRTMGSSNTNNSNGINYPYIEKLLENSHTYLEKYRTQCNDTSLSMVMERVAQWISTAKAQLDAYFK